MEERPSVESLGDAEQCRASEEDDGTGDAEEMEGGAPEALGTEDPEEEEKAEAEEGASSSGPPGQTATQAVGGSRTKCPCSGCNYECCLLARQHGQPLDVDAIAMELRLFLASQERMVLDVRRFRENRADTAGHDARAVPGDSSADQYHAVASTLDDLAQRATTESCEHLANTLGELVLLRTALGPVVDTVLVSGLHRLRDLRRRTGTPQDAGGAHGGGSPAAGGSMSSTGSIMPMSAHEMQHHHGGGAHSGGHPSRARFVTFPSEAAPDSRLAEEWRAVLGRGRGTSTPKQRPYASECLKARPTFSSECMGSAPFSAQAAAGLQRSHSASEVASLTSTASPRALSLEANRSSTGATRRSASSSIVQRSRSRSRITLASLSAVAGVTGITSLGSQPSADSGLAQSGASYPPSTAQSDTAEALDDSGDVLRDAAKSLSLEGDRFGEPYKEDLGTCAFFGSRLPSGDRERASRTSAPEAELTLPLGDGLGDVEGNVWLDSNLAEANVPQPGPLSLEDDDEDLRALKEEIERKAAVTSAPARELFTAQVVPQKSEVQLVADGEGAADAEQRWARLEEGDEFEDEEREQQADLGRAESMTGVKVVSSDTETRDLPPTVSPIRTSSEPLGYRMDEAKDDATGGQALPGSPAPEDGDQRAREKSSAPTAGTAVGAPERAPAGGDDSKDRSEAAPTAPAGGALPAAAGARTGADESTDKAAAPEPEATLTGAADGASAAAAGARPETGQSGDERVAPEPETLRTAGLESPPAVAPTPGERPQTDEPPGQELVGRARGRDAVAAPAASGSGAGAALVRIVSSPFQIARALLGPAVHFRPPSKDAIPRCHQALQQARAQPAPSPSPSGPSFDYLRGGFRWPDLSFVFGRTIHQAAADSIREMTATEAQRRPKVRGRSCSRISAVPSVPEQSSSEE